MLSYRSGPSDRPLIGETIGNHLDRIVARQPGREALIARHQGVRWTYQELRTQVQALAAGLIALGLGPGDRIGIWSPNCAEWIVTQYAAAKAGLILVTLNPAYRTGELAYALRKVGCKAVVCAERFKSSNYIEMLRGLTDADQLPALRYLINIGSREIAGFRRFDVIASLASQREHDRLAELGTLLQFDDPINIQFTSGTTGSPKGATLTHHNILNNAYDVCGLMGLVETDRLCVPVPLYHCFGMVMGTLGALTHGATLILPSEGFDATATLDTVEEERCTALYGVPTMFVNMLSHPEFGDYDCSSLRTGIMAGSPCPIAIMRRAIDEMHLSEITIAYGMTETSPVSCQTSPSDPIELRVSSVGRVLPHLEVKLVDIDGRIVPPNVPGELCVRGYSVMPGYWADAEKTNQVIDESRWMHTGDLATMDEAGYFAIVGRLKDMVIRGGENIYPREIEEFLYKHPKVEAAQAFGVPDQTFGEELCVWIKLRADASADEIEIRAYVQEHLAHFKIPRYVRFVESFPMTVTGKVQKFLMREEMIKVLGLNP